MTIQEAYKQWSAAPRNVILSAKYHTAVQKVLMKKYNDIDLEQVTECFARRIFHECKESQELKAKAASILVYVLQWGGDHGYCQRPSFDYSIANETEKEKRAAVPKPLYEIANQRYVEEPFVKVKPEALEKRMKELGKLPDFEIDNDNKTIKVKTMGKETTKVVQIDKDTLKPIKTFESVSDVKKELGIGNIHRAIERKGLSGGYYWCLFGDEGNFKPKTAASNGKPTTTPQKKEKAATEPKNGKPIGMSLDYKTVYVNDITKCTDEEIISEIKRRGWTGNIEFVKRIAL